MTETQSLPDYRDDSTAYWLKENVEAILVAFVMALVIRCFCLEVFKIPTASMQPTLLGQEKDYNTGRITRFGDRIMVNKFIYELQPVRRYDVSVFRFPLNQSKNFIKRVVGVGPEDLFFYAGNVYTRRDGETEFSIRPKPFETQQHIWTDVGVGPSEINDSQSHVGTEEDFLGSWRMSSDGDVRTLYGERGLEVLAGSGDGAEATFEFKNTRTDLNVRGGGIVQDLKMAMDVVLPAGAGSLTLAIANGHGRFELALAPDKQPVLTVFRDNQQTGAELDGLITSADEESHIELMFYDGRVRAGINGEYGDEVVLLETEEPGSRFDDSRVNVSFTVDRLNVTVGDLRLYRDIQYFFQSGSEHVIYSDEALVMEDDAHVEVPGHYLAIPDNKFFMVGDNVSNSHDSRAWRIRVFQTEDDNGVLGDKIYAENFRGGSGPPPVEFENGEARVYDRWGRLHSGETPKIWELRWCDPPDGTDRFLIRDYHDGNRGVSEKKGGLGGNSTYTVITEDGSEKTFKERKPSTEAYREFVPFVDHELVMGRAFWIWWPTNRWFQLIK